jgi:YHS domain-containing protein
MKDYNKTFWVTMGFVGVIFLGLAILNGCKKQTQPVTNTNAVTSIATEQTMCPVQTDMKIDKNIFVEYKGKKVYFCCTDCKALFEKDPEKYISKLPQFAK